MIGAVLAGLELASSAAGIVGSFTQANKQKKFYEEAKADAAKSMVAAKKAINVNYYNNLAIPTQAYEMERDLINAASAQATEAGREGDQRGVAATAGRVQAATADAARGVRADMSKDLYNLDKLTQEENSRIATKLASLDLAEAEGAQLAAADAQKSRTAAITQGFAGVADFAGKAAGMLPLYEKTKGAKMFANLQKDYLQAGQSGKLSSDYLDESGNPIDFQQAIVKMGGFGANVGSLDANKFQNYITSLPYEQMQSAFQDKSFMPTETSSNEYYLKGMEVNPMEDFDLSSVISGYKNLQKK